MPLVDWNQYASGSPATGGIDNVNPLVGLGSLYFNGVFGTNSVRYMTPIVPVNPVIGKIRAHYNVANISQSGAIASFTKMGFVAMTSSENLSSSSNFYSCMIKKQTTASATWSTGPVPVIQIRKHTATTIASLATEASSSLLASFSLSTPIALEEDFLLEFEWIYSASLGGTLLTARFVRNSTNFDNLVIVAQHFDLSTPFTTNTNIGHVFSNQTSFDAATWTVRIDETYVYGE